MEFTTIILLVIIIVLLYVVYNYISNDINTLTGLNSAQMMQTIKANDLEKNNSVNFTYSIWLYIDDWNTHYGKEKYIFGRMPMPQGSERQPCPLVYLDKNQNDIVIELTTTKAVTAVQASSGVQAVQGVSAVIKKYTIQNIPIQKWVFFMMSVYGRTLDVYIDGKLVNTFVLPDIPVISQDTDVYVTPDGGFSGWTTRFQYSGDATNPQTAWDMYKKGYGGSLLGDLFGKYSVKVALLENDKENSSITI